MRWLGPYKPTDRHADDVTMQDIVRLRVENDRMREALEKIRIFAKQGKVDMNVIEVIAYNGLKAYRE